MVWAPDLPRLATWAPDRTAMLTKLPARIAAFFEWAARHDIALPATSRTPEIAGVVEGGELLLPSDLEPAGDDEIDFEDWTLRKSLRRIVRHELGHSSSIRRILGLWSEQRASDGARTRRRGRS